MTNSVFKKYGDKLLLALALAVLAAGLVRVAIRSANMQEPAGIQPASIVFTQWWDRSLGGNVLLNLINEFENLYEGVKVIPVFVPYEELRQMLFFPSEENSPGDVFAIDPLWIAELGEKGILESAGQPILSFMSVLFYNTDILREAGFFMPPKTRSEFIACARRVADMRGNYAALVMDANGSRRIYDDIFPWVWAGGIQLARDGRPQANSRQLVDSLGFLSSLANEGLIVYGDKLQTFRAERAAFMIASASEVDYVRMRLMDTSFDISTVPLPDNYAGVSYYGSTEWAVGISSSSEKKAEAKLFADFLGGKAHILAENAGAIGSLPNNDHFHSKVWEIAIAWEPALEFSGLPWEEMGKTFSGELSLLFAGETSPGETAAAIQRSWAERLLQ